MCNAPSQYIMDQAMFPVFSPFIDSPSGPDPPQLTLDNWKWMNGSQQDGSMGLALENNI